MKNVYDGIIGVAIGDALGVPVEFQSRQELAQNPVVSMRAYGTHQQAVGTWSDDTSLTLAFMASIVEKQSPDYADMMDKFTDWLMYQDYTASGEVFDVGTSTSRAIMNYGRGINPLECGGITEYENGNGSLMRILPLAYYLEKQNGITLESQMEMVHNVSSLTHRHPVSLVGCGIYIKIAMLLLTTNNSLPICIEQGIKEAFIYYDSLDCQATQNYGRLRDVQHFSELPETEIKSSGYIVDTLEAALWCLLNSDSYRECLLKAVNLGDDTDTVGAVAGGLAGIYYGADTIPDEWMTVLVNRKMIEELCEKFQKVK